MKSIYIVRGLIFCTTLSFAGIALGCSGGECGSGNGGSGGTDPGHVCTWDATGGGITIPDCSAYRDSINLVGTIDGMPFDSLWTNNPTAVSPAASEYLSQALDVVLPSGHLHLWWAGTIPRGEWIDVGGELRLPLETTDRAVVGDSRIRLKCGAFLYQYILTVEGGELTGCSVN
jgi:hypothetical protein